MREFLPIAGNVEDVEFLTVTQLVGQVVQLVIAQRQDVEANQIANVRRQVLQSIAVHVHIRQFRQLTHRARDFRQKVLRQDQLLKTHASVQQNQKRRKKKHTRYLHYYSTMKVLFKS